MSAVDLNKYYCLGFAFYDNNVVLIMKTHPRPQAGLLNGIGGHIEKIDIRPEEVITEFLPSVRAMVREFEEETKVQTTEIQWFCKGLRVYNNLKKINDQPYKSYVSVFYTKLNDLQIKQLVSNNSLNQEVENEEYVCIYPLNEIKELHQKNLLVRDTLKFIEEGLELLGYYKTQTLNREHNNDIY